jgi:hypothetical protein
MTLGGRRSIRPAHTLVQWAAGRLISLAGLLGILSSSAQADGVHYFHQGNLQPGLIGAMRLQQGGPVVGYFQPVQIRAPSGARIALAEAGTFTQPEATPLTVGLLVGRVYRLRVTDIAFFVGREVYPTLEIIDRIYPPQGLEWQYPIVVDLTLEDIRIGLEGRFVTKVIYLEDPQRALPVAEPGTEQNWFEAPPGTDPLTIADRLGRPVAILRLGGRVPQTYPVPDEGFLFGCPPFIKPAPPATSGERPVANEVSHFWPLSAVKGTARMGW